MTTNIRLALFALLFTACPAPTVDTPSPDAGDALPWDDGGTQVPADDGGLYGIDVRPANPTCIAPERPVVDSGVKLTRAYPGVSFSGILGMFMAPGDTSRVYVQERGGRVRVFPNDPDVDQASVQVALDLSARVNTSGEGGFLGMAFHPDWAKRKELFVSYTRTGTGGAPLVSVLSRFRSSDGGKTFDGGAEEVLLELEQPYTNHNGGAIGFGPDGFLYMGFGDGGSGGDPLNAGQRTNTLLGKMIRIDVNVPASQRYAIPADNPYASTGAPCNLNSAKHTATNTQFCAEIYAIGFRNPWRWSFDSATGELWVGDVGQNAWEEINRVVLGGNYGWKIREGAHCFGAQTCDSSGLIDPVVEYDHSHGRSITGGYVYRGTKIPALYGRLIYGDFQSGRVWAIAEDGETGAAWGEALLYTDHMIGSFAQTPDGEVFVLDMGQGGIWRIEPIASGNPEAFPQKLSQTGCFDPVDPTQPVDSMIPYEIVAPFWSDGAEKERYFALPDGATITVEWDGDWTFPNGSVLAKTFRLEGKPVETRLFMHHPDGVWAGYSYEWNDEGTDATLLSGSKTKAIGQQTWYFPSSAECLGCHTEGAGRTLGPETAQLNRSHTYPSGRTRNQLDTLEGIGFFAEPLTERPKLEDPAGEGPLEARARAYLHANCSYCHREGGSRSAQDFRYGRSFAETNACDAKPFHGELGITDPRIIAPGDPARSVVSNRMHRLDAERMPPIGSLVVDEEGVALIDAWITSITACP